MVDDMYQDAVACGMSKHDFYHSTIKDVNIYMYAYHKNQSESLKMDEYRAWLNGIYVQMAIGASFSKHFKYPENPLAKKDIKSVSERSGKSEEELNRQLVYATLLVRQANANIQDSFDRDKVTEESGE